MNISESACTELDWFSLPHTAVSPSRAASLSARMAPSAAGVTRQTPDTRVILCVPLPPQHHIQATTGSASFTS